MKLAVIGAFGKTGVKLVRESHKRGHQVPEVYPGADFSGRAQLHFDVSL